MKLYYFIHLTGQDPGNTGIQRVVRNLGAALQARSDVELIPVRWNASFKKVVHAENCFREIIGLYHGPRFAPERDEGKPLSFNDVNRSEESWLLIPEAPHLKNHDPRFPSVQTGELFGYARSRGLRTAAILHDLLPLTSPVVKPSEIERLGFTAYAQSLFNADEIFPVSEFSCDHLRAWLASVGYRAEEFPSIRTIPLPGEMLDVARARNDRGKIIGRAEFISVGTVCPHKNQLKAMAAFNRLWRRRKDLDLVFNLVGHVAPDLAFACAREVAKSEGRIRMLGYQSDEHVVSLTRGAKATVFVSLAEGYGLPLSESLWLGTPCICSDLAPMKDMAVEGGCLLVDPDNSAEIETAMERIVSDPQLEQSLREALGRRAFRLWSDYAFDICQALSGSRVKEHVSKVKFVEDQERSVGGFGHEDGSGARDDENLFMKFEIEPTQLAIHEAYGKGVSSVFDGQRISFEARAFHGVDEKTIFYGPYIEMPAGRVKLVIDGSVDGAIMLRLQGRFGSCVVSERELTSFDEPIEIELCEPLANFEIVGRRTPATRGFEIWSISVECRELASALQSHCL